MSVFKREDVYWYHFVFNKRHIQRSTRQRNKAVAKQLEAAHRTRLVQEGQDREMAVQRLQCKDVVRCHDCEHWCDATVAVRSGSRSFCSEHCRAEWDRKHKPIPTLRDFCENRILPWAENQHSNSSPKTWLWYRTGIRAICDYPEWVGSRLDQVTTEKIAEFVAYRVSHSRRGKENSRAVALKITSVNSTLQVLRRVFKLALKWGVVQSIPTVEMLRNQNHRERVLSLAEEGAYLSVANEPLAAIATVLAESGLRPEECLRLRWENTFFHRGRNGLLFNPHGKTKAARRLIPMSERVRGCLECRWLDRGKPETGWVFPAETASGHAEPSTIKKQHRNALKASNVRPFVLYTFRHTFLTRLGESGCDVYTLARIAGHSNIAMSMRYVHPGEASVFDALERMEQKREEANRQVLAEGVPPLELAETENDL